MAERAGGVPGLDLLPEYKLDFLGVGLVEGIEDFVGKRKEHFG